MRSDAESLKCIDEAAGSALLHYAMGTLSEPERLAFEEHLIACQACQRELREHEASLAILSSNKPEIVRRLNDLNSQTDAEPKRGVVVWRTVLIAAAACLFGVLVWTTKTGTPDIAQNPPPIPESHISTPPDSTSSSSPDTSSDGSQVAPQIASLAVFAPIPYTPITIRSDESPARVTFRTAMESYMKGEYQSALPQLVVAQQMDTTDTEIGLFTGLVLGMEGKAESSLTVLETALRQHPRVTRTNQLKWLIAQNLLRSGKHEKALSLLNDVAASQTAVSQQAKEQIAAVQRLIE
ncbi:MAG: hypothetical protein H6508_08230 [Calditrichaeota bacterium]|nr:hypothetical protein [Calditrichota bacterium]